MFGVKAHSTPVVTAQLAVIAILAQMLFEAFVLFFRNINFAI